MTAQETDMALLIFAAACAIGAVVSTVKHVTRQTAMVLKHPFARKH